MHLENSKKSPPTLAKWDVRIHNRRNDSPRFYGFTTKQLVLSFPPPEKYLTTYFTRARMDLTKYQGFGGNPFHSLK